MTQVVQRLLWIFEVQAHINDCCASQADDLECMQVNRELQTRVDREWNSLGVLVMDRERPYSAIRG